MSDRVLSVVSGVLSCPFCGEVDPMTHPAWQCGCGRAIRYKTPPADPARQPTEGRDDG